METVKLSDVIESSKAMNDDVKATTAQAKQMKNYFELLYTGVSGASVGDIVVNTVTSGPIEAQLIPLQNIEPQPPDNLRLFYHVQVVFPSGECRDWTVSSWLSAVEHRGLDQATRDYMVEVDPNFSYQNYPKINKKWDEALGSIYEECAE